MDTICIVAFRVDTDRAVRYKKLPVKRVVGSIRPETYWCWPKVMELLAKIYEKDRADFVSIRFIRAKP